MSKNGKRTELSEIRAVACMAVVVLHTFRTFINQKSMTHNSYVAASIVRDCMNFAVPCFLMVTGTLLLDENRDISIKRIWKKYIPSIVIPLICCTILFSVTDVLFSADNSAHTAKGILINANLWKDILLDFWTDSGWKHLWYIYMLIGIYILLPFYRKIAKSSDNRELMYLIGMWMLFLIVLPQIGILTAAKPGFYVCTFTVYPLFLFLGYISDKRSLNWKHPFIVLLFSTMAMGVFSYLAYGQSVDKALKMIGTYAFLPVVFMAAGFYQSWMCIHQRIPTGIAKTLSKIDEYGFGIYIYHVLFIRIIKTYYHPSFVTIPTILGISILVFIITYGFVFVVKRVPGIKHIC